MWRQRRLAYLWVNGWLRGQPATTYLCIYLRSCNVSRRTCMSSSCSRSLALNLRRSSSNAPINPLNISYLVGIVRGIYNVYSSTRDVKQPWPHRTKFDKLRPRYVHGQASLFLYSAILCPRKTCDKTSSTVHGAHD